MALHTGQVVPAGLPHIWHSCCMAWARHAAGRGGRSSYRDGERKSCDARFIHVISAIRRWLIQPSTAMMQHAGKAPYGCARVMNMKVPPSFRHLRELQDFLYDTEAQSSQQQCKLAQWGLLVFTSAQGDLAHMPRSCDTNHVPGLCCHLCAAETTCWSVAHLFT